ncbi:MAG: InlB B-repeat-containing protein [Oscillospiraceae bacterium]|nr:InlB B-repeat-containing protein [Oscillospiraceae bacterium]
MKKRIFTTLINLCMAIALVAALLPALSVTTNAEITYTWEIPIEITVTNGGTTDASAISFGLLLYDPSGSEIDIAGFKGEYLENSQYVYTTGHGTYNATLRFQGGDQLKQHLADGFIVCLNDIGVDGWEHNDVEYEVVSCEFDEETGEMTEISIISVNTGYSVNTAAFECEYTGYYLRFETNGGSTMESVAVADGTTVDLSGYTPTRAGYTFTGWYSDSELTIKVSSVTLDATDEFVYAGWERYVTVGAVALADGQYTTNGTDINDGEPTGTSYAYYSDGVLTLSGYDITTTDTYGIYNDGDLEIVLVGENSVTSSSEGIYVSGDLTISGTGSLSVTVDNDNGDAYGIVSAGGIIEISECTVNVNATSSYNSAYAICAQKYDIAIEADSTVTATATGGAYAYGIYADDYVLITGSKVTVSAESDGFEACAICADDYSIEIQGGSEVEATVKGEFLFGEALSAQDVISGEITISGTGTKLTATTTSTSTDRSEAYAILSAFGTITIEDGCEVIATVTTVAGSGNTTDAIYSSITISDSSLTVTADGDYATAIGDTSEDFSISNSNVKAFASGASAIAIESYGRLTITGSEVTATAEGTALGYGIFILGNLSITSSEVEVTGKGDDEYAICIIDGDNGGLIISDSEVVADGGINLMTDGPVIAIPATDGSMKITMTNDTDNVIFTIDELTVIDTYGYTYVKVEAHEHAYDYDNIIWDWTDYENVTATVTCTDSGFEHSKTVTATVTSVASGSTVTYTATAEFDGKTYTATATVASTTSSTQSTASANYSAVREAIAKANALNPDDYEDFSAVTRAITNVNWSLALANQSAVNSMAAAINEAIANLVPVSSVEVVVDEPVEGTDLEVEE